MAILYTCRDMARPATFDLVDLAAAALDLVSRDGWSALTIRAVADELGVTPMALYRVVPDADALRLTVADAAAAPVQPELGGTSLDTALHDWAIAAHRHLAAHPGLAAYVIPVWTELPRWLDIVETFLAAAAADGLTGTPAVAKVNAVFAYVLARSQFRDQVRPSRALRPLADDPARFPHIAASRDEFAVAHVESHFRHGLDALLRGL
jgi:AcrR family transcriptional regulator